MTTGNNTDYNAQCIKVRHELVFDFEKIELLTEKYHTTKDFVRRGVETCRLMGGSMNHWLDYFEVYYLQKDRTTLQHSPEFSIVYSHNLKTDRDKLSS